MVTPRREKQYTKWYKMIEHPYKPARVPVIKIKSVNISKNPYMPTKLVRDRRPHENNINTTNVNIPICHTSQRK